MLVIGWIKEFELQEAAIKGFLSAFHSKCATPFRFLFLGSLSCTYEGSTSCF